MVSDFTIPDVLRHKDIHGDSVLHAACVTGHFTCVTLLSYCIRDESNHSQLFGVDLAKKAGYDHIATYLSLIEQRRHQGEGNRQLFGDGIDFATYASFIRYYGSRWSKGYDPAYQACYYVDNITNISQWERPLLFDMSPQEETAYDQARDILHRFYSQYNPDKAHDMNALLVSYRNRYTELFIYLANKYEVQDLSMFAGVNFD
jgi:hypothetical protein